METKVITANNLNFITRPGTTDKWIVNEVVTENIYQLTTMPKKTVIDIGAHIGTFSIYASSLGANVYSYEATTMNFNLLKANIQLNESPAHIFKFGVTGKRETRKIYLRPDNLGASNMYSDEEEILERVKCIGLDQVFETNHIKRCYLLKLDCEGAEVEILKGTAKIGLVDTVIVETHRGDSEQVLQLMKKTHRLTEQLAGGVNPILKFVRV